MTFDLNLRGKSHDKGFSKDADTKASEGFIPFGGFFCFCINTKKKGGGNTITVDFVVLSISEAPKSFS